MSSENQKIIFLNSFLPRTGHNFVSEVIKIFSEHEVLINARSETKISTLLESYFNIYEKGIHNQPNRNFFEYLFINNLRGRILKKSNKHFVMIKDTSFIGVDHLPKVFPDDIHFILIRDPRNVFLSLLKAMNLRKKDFKSFLKSLTMPLGLYPYFYSRKLTRQILANFPDLSNREIIRYEDLVEKNELLLMRLQNMFGSDISIPEIKSRIDKINVINSSFFEETKGKKIWDIKPKTKEYDPIKRKYKNYLVRMGVELGSRRLRKKLNYI